MLRVYNTLTRTKEPFEPVRPGKVGIYLCGPTVYKPSHIGHMVGPVIFDAIKRYLAYSGYDVTLVVNITDVDDKLIAESNARGVKMSQLAAEMTDDYMHNLGELGVDVIDHFPRCTETMAEIIELTKTLVEKGFAYEASGDVYFEVAKCPDYGKLSHRGVDAMRGEGGGMADRKRSSADFALWKSAKPGEPSWPSPWGQGRPGWHIECSAMSRKLLGETFDIHGGGLDLAFPHHENEIAQSECAHGKPMAKYWLHNGLMQASSEVGKVGGRATRPAEGDLAAQEAGKISKSKGSAPFRDMLKKFSGETVRFFVLSTHYRRPIDYSEERLAEVQTGMETFHRFFKRFERIA
ncbi:MAG: cysteine--tRNA ligase, partial [Planctomycetaceae bacterium]|nr:cysteine--tRNA ligase [Planctomycetaceae bacterium]